jgi:dienelactone hydrolase
MATIPRIAAAATLVALAAGALASSSTQAQRLSPYVSDQHFEAGVTDGIVLTDPARGGYRVPLLVRYPIGATDRRPVVIWNHGGNPSEIGRMRSQEWGERLARAGYVVIQPSRVDPTDLTAVRPECDANGFAAPAECAFWIANMRYGPQSVSFIIDRLAEIEAARPALRGHLDTTRIVVAGHSAGTTSVLAVAGAQQQFVAGGPVYDESDPRPVAFLATGPQGPTYAGFRSGFDETRSFLGIDRPFLFVTGMGDETGEPVPTRLTAWLTARPHDKWLVWDTQPEAVHETMDVHQCATPLQARHCDLIGSVGVAYLDAVVRQRQAAIRWMASDALLHLSTEEIELHQR